MNGSFYGDVTADIKSTERVSYSEIMHRKDAQCKCEEWPWGDSPVALRIPTAHYFCVISAHT